MRAMFKDYIFWICMIPLTIIVVGFVMIFINGGK